MNDRLSRQFRERHLTPALGEVLHAVALEGEASSSALARRIGITPQSIKQSIHALEKHGFVRRTVAKHDQRILTVHLTRSGEEAQRFCLRALDDMYPDIFGALTAAEFARLTRLLTKVVQNTHRESLELYGERRGAS
jgi:DNA-binding MarR family transcriptional regulator